MKKMKRIIALVLMALSLLAVALPALAEATISGSGPNSRTTVDTIRSGSRSWQLDTKTTHSDIKILQQILNDHGFDCGTADGIYGAKTVAGVKAFQQWCKTYDSSMVVDGYFGKKSMEKLESLNGNCGWGGGGTGGSGTGGSNTYVNSFTAYMRQASSTYYTTVVNSNQIANYLLASTSGTFKQVSGAQGWLQYSDGSYVPAILVAINPNATSMTTTTNTLRIRLRETPSYSATESTNYQNAGNKVVILDAQSETDWVRVGTTFGIGWVPRSHLDM